MEIHAEVNTEFMKDLAKRLSVDFNNAASMKILEDALALYNWAAREANAGRVILSSEQDGSDIKELSTKPLDNARALAISRKQLKK